MRRTMVAGNWKMHGTRASVVELINGRHWPAQRCLMLWVSSRLFCISPKWLMAEVCVDPVAGAHLQWKPWRWPTGETAPSQLSMRVVPTCLSGQFERY